MKDHEIDLKGFSDFLLLALTFKGETNFFIEDILKFFIFSFALIIAKVKDFKFMGWDIWK